MTKPSTQEQKNRSAQEEKRTALRVRLVCPLGYQLLENGSPHGPLRSGSTENLSTGGALIRTTHSLPLSTHLRIQIQLPGIKQALIALSRVVRVEEEVPAQKYLLGVVFEKIEPHEPAEFLKRIESLDIRKLLEELITTKASDLHLTTGHPPIVRIQGRLSPLKRSPFLQNEIQAFLYSILSEEQIASFEKIRELDFAYSIDLDKRFRFNLHWQRGQVEAAIRVIPAQVTPWKELGLPSVLMDWIQKPHGLILIVGPTGSGKTTTMSSLVHQINQDRGAVVICLERPIEYVHTNIKSIIKQREVGSDTLSFGEAVKRALRQDPDVIVVGEIEDAETAEVVLNASETGNLVLASFHATDTIQAIDRFLNLCPVQKRQQMSFQLASCLQGIITQYLLPREKAMGSGLVLATEVFVPTQAGRSLIRNNSLSQLYSTIETGGAYKMHTLESSLQQLVTQGIVAQEDAQAHLALSGRSKSS